MRLLILAGFIAAFAVGGAMLASAPVEIARSCVETNTCP
jgi:FlaG/FlaF family flagellin (archaellin)